MAIHQNFRRTFGFALQIKIRWVPPSIPHKKVVLPYFGVQNWMNLISFSKKDEMRGNEILFNVSQGGGNYNFLNYVKWGNYVVLNSESNDGNEIYGRFYKHKV